MSRVGKKPIVIPAAVEVQIDGLAVTIKGPKGQLSYRLHPLVSAALGEVDGARVINLSVAHPGQGEEKAQWGTARAILANLLQGVTQGFSKSLEVNGVGFRVNVAGSNIVLNVGFSHEVKIPLPEGITAEVKENVLTLSGLDPQRVGEIAAQIRKIQPPEPYKGKGIKYTDETIRRKAGKAAAKASE
jgi:large subunit ribosomal protein L6